MRYLLLIPACLAMLCSVFFYGSLMLYRWPRRATVFCLLAAVTFQFGGILIAAGLDP